MLDKYAPDVAEDLNTAVWDAIRVNGKLYGIPLQQIYVSEPVATQIAQCSAVVEEYLPARNCGAVEVDSTLEAFNAALTDAGVDQIIAEMQSQIDAWLAAK